MGEPIIGVVLAAGTSSRLGRPKQLEMVAGKPLLVHTIERALGSSLDAVVVVVGAEEAGVRAAIDGLPVQIVSNRHFASGQASSVLAGVDEAQSRGAEAIVFLLADQPGVLAGAIDRLVDARRMGGAPVAMATYGERPSHPVLFGREVFPELLELRGDMGGRDIVRRHRSALVLVDGGRKTIPPDLDDEGDLATVERDLQSLDPGF